MMLFLAILPDCGREVKRNFASCIRHLPVVESVCKEIEKMEDRLKTLVLIPMKPNMPPELRDMCIRNSDRLKGDGTEVVIDSRGKGDEGVVTLEERVAHTVGIRNGMIKDYFDPARHSGVLWLDADIVEYPADIVGRLWRSGGGNVVAPAVYLQGYCRRWYDTMGFVCRGKAFRFRRPYARGCCKREDGLLELDGVGCVYLVPSAVYASGARHEPRPGFTDHLAVCEHARGMGLKVLCDMSIEVFHAYLTKYGERAH